MAPEVPYRLHIRGGVIVPIILVPSTECTIFEVKKEIEARLGVQVDRQTLWSLEEHKKMEDSKKIGDYSVCKFEIRLEVQPPPENATHKITVISTDNVEHKFVVKETETVLELKKKLERKVGAKAEEMRLIVEDYGKEMRNDDPLFKYYVRDGTKVTAKIKEAGKTDSGMGSPSTSH